MRASNGQQTRMRALNCSRRRPVARAGTHPSLAFRSFEFVLHDTHDHPSERSDRHCGIPPRRAGAGAPRRAGGKLRGDLRRSARFLRGGTGAAEGDRRRALRAGRRKGACRVSRPAWLSRVIRPAHSAAFRISKPTWPHAAQAAPQTFCGRSSRSAI